MLPIKDEMPCQAWGRALLEHAEGRGSRGREEGAREEPPCQNVPWVGWKGGKGRGRGVTQQQNASLWKKFDSLPLLHHNNKADLSTSMPEERKQGIRAHQHANACFSNTQDAPTGEAWRHLHCLIHYHDMHGPKRQ